MRAELVLGAAQRAGASATAGPANNAFLQQRLSYDGERLLDADARGVMMAWEGAPPPLSLLEESRTVFVPGPYGLMTQSLPLDTP